MLIAFWIFGLMLVVMGVCGVYILAFDNGYRQGSINGVETFLMGVYTSREDIKAEPEFSGLRVKPDEPIQGRADDGDIY